MNPRRALLPLTLAFAPLACGGPEVAAPKCPPTAPPSAAPAAPSAAPSPAAPPTEDEARQFLDQVDKDLRRLWVARDRAAWVNENFITDDTKFLAAAGEEATAEYMTRTIKAAARFDGLKLPEPLRRQLTLLKIAQGVPAPSDAAERRELATLQRDMSSAYGAGKFCPPRLKGKCLTLDDLTATMRTSTSEPELLEAWTGWHAISPPLKAPFARYVELGNKGAKEIGFSDLGAIWRGGYDMPAEEFEKDAERLFTQLKPLYESLHCYVRQRLNAKYGAKAPKTGPIPAHLLGNMWAQEWQNIYPLVEPYKGQLSLDVSKKLEAKKTTPEQMVRLGEAFFVSLGFDPLPAEFWKRSLFVRPADREVECHASAWDPSWNNDLRIKMCIRPTENDLITIHHELGHDYYFHQYYKLPMLFQTGANDGFHEGIGDTLALSVTPQYLKERGLLDAVPNNPKAQINHMMKEALEKIAFLPFGYLIDKWRWDVFSGRTPKEKYNESWWALRLKYQGIAPPAPRTDADFDPGAKYHVPASVPYIRYFLARIYQFQFHRALCKVAGHKGPLAGCSIYGNKAAGDKLKAMLSLGASKSWQDALFALSGEREADASALVEYFAPLTDWLREQTKGEKCGW